MDYLNELVETRKASDPEFAQIWAAVELIDELAKRRQSLSLSQQDVADHMGVARARVSEIENHPERVSFARILAYATAVGAHLTVNGKLTPTDSGPSPRGRPVTAVGANRREKRIA